MRTFLEALEEDVLVVDERGQILFISEAFCEQLGYNQPTLVAQSITQIVVGDWQVWQYETKEAVALVFQTRSGALLNYKVQVVEAEWCGQQAWYIVGEVCALGTLSEEEARCILEQLPMLIVSKNVEGKYTYINEIARAYCEYSSEEIIGKKDREIDGEYMGMPVEQDDQTIMTNQTSSYVDSWTKTRTGKLKVLNVYKTPIYDAQQAVCGLVKFAKPIIVNKWVELEQAHQFNQLFKMIETGKKETKWNQSLVSEWVIEGILKEIQAEGISIWLYDAEAQKIVCQCADSHNKQIVRESLGIELLGYEIACNQRGSGCQDIFSMEEIDLVELDVLCVRTRLQESGIRFMGIFDITYGGEFLGIINFLYKQYNPQDQEQLQSAKRVCDKLAEYIKQIRLSEELEKTLQKRINTEEALDGLLGTISDGIWVSDDTCQLFKVSRSICEVLQVSEEEIKRNGLMHYIYEEDRGFYMDMQKKIKGNPGETNRWVIRVKTQSGEMLWVECGGKYVVDKQMYLYTGRNVTYQYRLKEQQSLYGKKKQLERLKEEFLANVPQDFKALLYSLLADEQQLKGQAQAEEHIEKYSHYIKKNSYRLLRLVNNLIDSMQINAGEYEITKENCEMVGFIQDICKAAAQYAIHKGIELYFESTLTEQVIACDPDKIERVLLNLIANAIKYTPRSGEILVKVGRVGQHMSVKVEDSGIGIPKEQLDQIFEPFVQIDTSLTRQNEGSGVGLSLARLLVTLHSGQIYAESTLGVGSRITVELPNQRIDELPVGESRARLKRDRLERCRIEFADIYDLD